MRFVYVNELGSIEKLSADLAYFAQIEGVDAKVLASIHVVLDEIITNIIKYAYEHPRVSHQIEIEIEKCGQELHVQVSDDGKMFDPLEYHAVGRAKLASVEAAPVGGVGIRIVKSLVKKLTYAREKGRNILKFVKDL